jgi:hypothetical protein
VPSFNPPTHAAIDAAETANLEGVPVRVVGADYLAAIALSAGRSKDMTRIPGTLEAEAVTPDSISSLCARFDLSAQWERFVERFLND